MQTLREIILDNWSAAGINLTELESQLALLIEGAYKTGYSKSLSYPAKVPIPYPETAWEEDKHRFLGKQEIATSGKPDSQ